MDLPKITPGQLALCNGQDKPEIWVALHGKIYDVTASRLWRKGQHYEHWAGQDLTHELKDAPHTDKVFDKFEVVGLLINRIV
jgi:predicted heme/steroid binding protein